MWIQGGVKLLHLEWADIQRLAEQVAKKVRYSGFKPDVVVAVSRGGFDPARIICDQLSVRLLASLQIEHYKDINLKKSLPKIIFPLNADLSNLYALIVDDVSDSGASLNAVREHIEGRGAKDLMFATLHVKPWSTFRPDFYAEEVESWIIYPWEIRETLHSISRKLRNGGLKTSELKCRLEKVGFSRELIERLL